MHDAMGQILVSRCAILWFSKWFIFTSLILSTLLEGDSFHGYPYTD